MSGWMGCCSGVLICMSMVCVLCTSFLWSVLIQRGRCCVGRVEGGVDVCMYVWRKGGGRGVRVCVVVWLWRVLRWDDEV